MISTRRVAGVAVHTFSVLVTARCLRLLPDTPFCGASWPVLHLRPRTDNAGTRRNTRCIIQNKRLLHRRQEASHIVFQRLYVLAKKMFDDLAGENVCGVHNGKKVWTWAVIYKLLVWIYIY